MIKLKIHSIVDVITNSSSELFVLDTNKSLNMVKEILEEAIKLNNKADDLEQTFKDIFQEPFISDKDNAGLKNWGITNAKGKICFYSASDNSIPYWMFEFIEFVFGYNTQRYHLG